MIWPTEQDTITSAFKRACREYQELPLLVVPANPNRDYYPAGYELSYTAAESAVEELISHYRRAGYGLGHRVGLFLDNRPEHLLHKLALNCIGACCVPVNPDYRSSELAYLIDHSKLDLVVVRPSRLDQLSVALASTSSQPGVVNFTSFGTEIPAARRKPDHGQVQPETPASILYTSGTTGRPKGCVLSHGYELAAGAWYVSRGGEAEIRTGKERLYNPLPLYHVNASVLSFYAMLLSGGCQIQSERFQPSRWWIEIAESRATIVHYLGVIVPMLLSQPTTPADRAHSVRFGIGAGVEPQLHSAFEERFGFPLIEIWGMTEIVRLLVDNVAPRNVGTRAFGRPVPGLEVKVICDDGQEAEHGSSGELLVRHSEAEPRKHFFSGYLDDPEATERAWRGGWFHTGDVVSQNKEGMLFFVDRLKNIIRRSGENIAAAEVEAMLLTHPLVAQAAVLAVRDDIREEEVLACITLDPALDASKSMDKALRSEFATQIFEYCSKHLAYYKAPGWILFMPEIPKTGTQKVQKHRIFSPEIDPRDHPEIVDLRTLKKRS
ncbi:putative sulfoacetate--CoA ligase [compost metagenome]